MIAGAVTLLLVTFVLRDEAFRSTVRYSIQGIALMPLFHYAVKRPKSMLFRPLYWAPVRRIGIYSYTIYLSHFVIIHALEILGLDIENSITFAPVAAVLSIAWAAAVYKYIETPLRPLRARLTGHGGGSGAMQTKDQFAAP